MHRPNSGWGPSIHDVIDLNNMVRRVMNLDCYSLLKTTIRAIFPNFNYFTAQSAAEASVGVLWSQNEPALLEEQGSGFKKMVFLLSAILLTDASNNSIFNNAHFFLLLDNVSLFQPLSDSLHSIIERFFAELNRDFPQRTRTYSIIASTDSSSYFAAHCHDSAVVNLTGGQPTVIDYAERSDNLSEEALPLVLDPYRAAFLDASPYILFVECPNDIAFLQRHSQVINGLMNSARLLLIPLGGRIDPSKFKDAVRAINNCGSSGSSCYSGSSAHEVTPTSVTGAHTPIHRKFFAVTGPGCHSSEWVQHEITKCKRGKLERDLFVWPVDTESFKLEALGFVDLKSFLNALVAPIYDWKPSDMDQLRTMIQSHVQQIDRMFKIPAPTLSIAGADISQASPSKKPKPFATCDEESFSRPSWFSDPFLTLWAKMKDSAIAHLPRNLPKALDSLSAELKNRWNSAVIHDQSGMLAQFYADGNELLLLTNRLPVNPPLPPTFAEAWRFLDAKRWFDLPTLSQEAAGPALIDAIEALEKWLAIGIRSLCTVKHPL